MTAFQTDLLLFAVNPPWVKYGTPATVLAQAEVIRYREQDEKPQPFPQAMPSIAQIEATWRAHFVEEFASNYQRWGVGHKDNGICRLERAMFDGGYRLTVQNNYHEDVFMGGDSNCFAPPLYYATVQVQMTKSTTDADGYGFMFEAINDECYAFFRIRERLRRISVVQTRNGGDNATIYLRQVPAPALQPGAWNKLAILAIHEEHWFYVNDQLVGHQVLPRLSLARLDVGIAAGAGQEVVCTYRRLRVTVP